MITAMLLGLLQLAAPSSGPAPVEEVGGGDVVFTRVEPHLAAGARALAANDPELALERYRRAEATSDEQRAVVEYNAGQALLLQAMKTAAAQQPAPTTPPTPAAEPVAPPPPADVSDALSSFERAASLGKSPTFISEARLAAGNAALVGNKLDDAIAQLRKALVADPRNERARHNLQRALELKKQQPPQQNDGDGEKNDDKQDKDEEKKNEEQKSDKDEQKNDKGEQKSDKQKNDKGEQKSDEQKNDKGEQKSDEQKNDKSEQKSDEHNEGEQKPDGAASEPKPAPKKPTSREEARRLLDGVRSREKPLSPIEMRAAERRPAENGKDW